MNRASYQREYRLRRGRAYADSENERVKNYQATLAGSFALKAGWLNSDAKARGVEGRVSGADLLDLWLRQNEIDLRACRCASCRTVTTSWHIDHVVRIRDGGAHSVENLQILCVDCHKQKTREEADVFRVQPGLFSEACGG